MDLLITALAMALAGHSLQITNNDRLMGAQCRFADGSKAVILEHLSHNTRYIIIRRSQDSDDLSTISLNQNGEEDLETNGGVEKHQAIRRLDDELKTKANVNVGKHSLQRFLSSKAPVRCLHRTLFEGL